MPVKIEQPYPVFRDKIGLPLDGGLIYIGTSGLNPETNPIQCYFDEDFTLLAPQPLRTINGYISRNGSPANIFLKVPECSITIKDRFRITQYTDLNFQLSNFGVLTTSQIFDDSGASQQEINDGIESIDKLRLLNPKKVGSRVYLVSANKDQNDGGGFFVGLDSSLSLIDNNGTIINSANPAITWVRINYDYVTPEMFRSPVSGDSTNSLTNFFNFCATGVRGVGKKGKTYTTNNQITTETQSSINIDFNNSTIKPNFVLLTGERKAALYFKSTVYNDKSSFRLSNLFIDNTLIPAVDSTTAENLTGFGGLLIESFADVIVNSYQNKNSFFSAGLFIKKFNTAVLDGINLIDVGRKFNPDSDDTGVYDASGDGIYLGDFIGVAKTTISNSFIDSYINKYGRCGIVSESFTDDSISHTVEINNTDINGYQRILHQEDGGKSIFVWNTGKSNDYSNLVYNLGAVENRKHFVLNNVITNVNPRFGYGGTSGVQNYQGVGILELNNCEVSYSSNVTERGNKLFNNTLLNLSSSTVDLGASTKPMIINGGLITTSSGKLYSPASAKGFRLTNNLVVNGGTSSIINSFYSVNGSIYSDSSVTFNNSDVAVEQLLPTGSGRIEISATFNISLPSPSVLFSGSYNSGIDLIGAKINSLNKVTLYSDGFVRYRVNSSGLHNVLIGAINTTLDYKNSFVQVTDNEISYDDNYGDNRVFDTFGTFSGIFKGNTITSLSTTDVPIPESTTTFKSLNNTHIHAGVIS